MVGIVSYGAYVPLRRLGKGTQGWRSPNEKAIAYYDEDSLTMAVAASLDCLRDTDRETIDGLYFASTTSPYKEKSIATTVAFASDIRRDIQTVDVTNTLRAGSAALKLASDTIKACSAKNVMVVASDCRLGAPRSEEDQTFGDGAAAFIIGDTNVIATIEAFYSVSNELHDVWRSDTGNFVRSWEDRFVFEKGYFTVVPPAVTEFMKRNKLKAEDITKVALYGPNIRRHTEMVKRLGFKPEQISDSLLSSVGNTGTASVPMMLVSALENAKPGDTILCISYGNGADVLLLKVTDEITKIGYRRGIANNLKYKMIYPSYDMYFGFHHQAGNTEVGGSPSSPVVAREREAIYPFYGNKCNNCGQVMYPPQRVCINCKTKDNYEYIRLSDKKAKIFIRVLDYSAPVPSFDSPSVDRMVDWEGGGRALLSMTDKDPNNVQMGMDVEMTFRKIRSGGGMHSYFWKCTTPRESWVQKEVK